MKKVGLISVIVAGIILLALVSIYNFEIMLSLLCLAFIFFMIFLTIASVVNAHRQIKEYRKAKKS